MKNKIIILYVSLIILLQSTSCKKFLQEQSNDEIIPTSTQDFIELLNGEGYISNTEVFQQALTLVDDDVRSNYSPKNGSAESTRQNAQKLLPIYSWQPNAYEQLGGSDFGNRNFNPWIVLYKYIAGANIALQYADKSVGTESNKNYLKGQAYTLRAYYYFLLVNFYGLPYNYKAFSPNQNLGVPLITNSDYNEASSKRNTVQEVYNQILSDLDNAIKYLEIDKKRNNIYRINDLTAHFIKAKVNLYMENWNGVMAETNTVLKEKNNLIDLNSWSTVSISTNPFIKATNPESIFCYGSPFDYQITGAQNVYCIAEDLTNTFENGDLRKGIFIVPTTPEIARENGYAYISGKLSIVGNAAAGSGTAFRTAELYLNRAEAAINIYKKNNDITYVNSAINDLNTLRKARFSAALYKPWSFSNIDNLYADYKSERRRELCLENQRWFDLRRYGMPSIKHVFYGSSGTDRTQYTLDERDPSYVFQIPQQIIDRNPNIEQNLRGNVKIGLPL